MQRSIAGLAFALFALPLAAQQQPDSLTPMGALATREFLQAALARFDQRSPAAALIRTRLATGDFQPGDRILIRVQAESLLTDTFTVAARAAGPELVLPQVGPMRLTGVLRSELKGRLEAHLRQFIRAPVVLQAQPLMRILAEGEVTKPGFYAVEPALPLADMLSVAGGLTQRARITDIRIERGRDKIWSGPALQAALGRGESLDQLNLRPGDRVFVPGRGDSERSVRLVGLILGIPLTVVGLTRLFH